MTRDWNRLPDATPDATACPDCGAPIPGGRRACRAIYHDINLRFRAGTSSGLSETRPARLGETRPRVAAATIRIGRLLVDSYALQHLDPYCRTAKELIYHIASLCCGLEFGGSTAIYAALQRSIDGAFRELRPTPPEHLGDLTIANLAATAKDTQCAQRIETWARSVWNAYSPLQPLARDWIKRAMAE
jgi:hypothetical protein